jgi:hypothetical protein
VISPSPEIKAYQKNMWARFSDYISAVIVYWQFWVAVGFWGERAVERFFPRIWRWAEPNFTPERRRRVFVGLAIIAFVYANFRAFDHERSLRDQTVGAQLRYIHPGASDPPQNGKSMGMRLDCINGGSLPSVGLIFEHQFRVFDHPLTTVDENSEMLKLKQAADKRRSELADFEIQPNIPFTLLADDPDNILMEKKEGSDLIYYLFALLEYKDRMLPSDELWITEICFEMSKRGTFNCSTNNRIYRSK